jgi:hypothetical protein
VSRYFVDGPGFFSVEGDAWRNMTRSESEIRADERARWAKAMRKSPKEETPNAWYWADRLERNDLQEP